MSETTNDLVVELLPHARRIATMSVDGLAGDASDATCMGLALAHVNFERKTPGWCDCKLGEFGVYFRDLQSGTHGWLCATCGRVCQTG